MALLCTWCFKDKGPGAHSVRDHSFWRGASLIPREDQSHWVSWRVTQILIVDSYHLTAFLANAWYTFNTYTLSKYPGVCSVN